MPENTTRRRTLLVALVLALVAGGAVLAWQQRGLPDDVAVRVGERDVTRAQLTERARSVKALYGVEQPEAGSKRATFRRDLAKSEVLAVMVDRAAAQRDIEVADAKVQETLDRYIATQYGEGEAGRTAFTQALADAGTSEKAVRTEVRRQLVVSLLYDAVTAKVAAPTAAEVDAAYAKRSCLFRTGPQRRLANIVVATREEGEDVLRRVRGGSFAAVARDTSLDGSSLEQGGDIGFVTREQLEEEYAVLAFGTPVGGVFGPVETRHGWNVGRVVAAKPAAQQPRAEAEKSLAELLTVERRSKVWKDFIRAQLRLAAAEYADDYRPADPVGPPAGLAGGGPATGAADKECAP